MKFGFRLFLLFSYFLVYVCFEECFISKQEDHVVLNLSTRGECIYIHQLNKKHIHYCAGRERFTVSLLGLHLCMRFYFINRSKQRRVFSIRNWNGNAHKKQYTLRTRKMKKDRLQIKHLFSIMIYL